MKERAEREVIILGGGPAGLAAAIAAKKAGAHDVLILERDERLGGILNQCIHNGFGLHTFHEELTGPEYAWRFIEEAEKWKIDVKLNTMVLSLSPQKEIMAMNKEDGVFVIQAKAVVLAMGCRERPRGALLIPGTRPAGIYSAGTAQRLVNMEGFLPGREVVILGSGDIGLIMARRMTLEGAKVKVVAELLPYSGGLKRNIVQCLKDYNIPLKLSHTVVEIHGKERLCGVTLAQVDEKKKPILGTEEYISCDTLLLSVGLIPENELAQETGILMETATQGPQVDENFSTSISGVFACGNVLHVHDLVDYVSEEAAMAGKHAAAFVKSVQGSSNTRNENVHEREDHWEITLKTGNGVRYTVPKRIHPKKMQEDRVTIRFRVTDVMKDKAIHVYFGDTLVKTFPKRVMAPGEMESVILQKKEFLDAGEELKDITIAICEKDKERT